MDEDSSLARSFVDDVSKASAWEIKKEYRMVL